MAPWTEKQFPNHSRDSKAEFDLTFSSKNSGYVHKNEQEGGNKRGDNEKNLFEGNLQKATAKTTLGLSAAVISRR